jgi:hypothetical protein
VWAVCVARGGGKFVPRANFNLARGTKCAHTGEFVPRAATGFVRGTLFPGASYGPLRITTDFVSV